MRIRPIIQKKIKKKAKPLYNEISADSFRLGSHGVFFPVEKYAM